MAESQTSTLIRGFSWGRYLLLGMISLILASSMVLTILAPFPLALATILFGRAKGWPLSLGTAAVAVALFRFNIWGVEVLLLYGGCVLFALILGEILKQNIYPMRGLFLSGLGVFLLTSALLLAGVLELPRLGQIPLQTQDLPAHQQVVQNLRAFLTLKMKAVGELIGKDKEGVAKMGPDQEVIDLFSHPELVVDQVIFAIPSSLFVAVFFGLWLNLFLLLRTNRLYRFNSSYSERDLLSFRMPEYMVWFVVLALGLSIFGEDVLSQGWAHVGKGLLQCLGLFYFFQGFGIFTEFLDYLRFQGIIRTLLVVFTIVSGWWVIACLGLFDLWFNFRKFFRKKIQQ